MEDVDILRERANEITLTDNLTIKDVYEPIFLFAIDRIRRPELVRNGAISSYNTFEYYTHKYCVFHPLKKLRKVRFGGVVARMALKVLNSEGLQCSDSTVKEQYEQARKMWYRIQMLATVPLRFMATKIMLELLDELIPRYLDLRGPRTNTNNRIGFIIRKLWLQHIVLSRRYRDKISLVRAEVARHTGSYMIQAPEVFGHSKCARVLDTALADEFNSVSRPALAEVIKIIKHWRKNLVNNDFTPEQKEALDMWKPHLEFILKKSFDMKMRDDADRALIMYTEDEVPFRTLHRKKRRTKAEMLLARLNGETKSGK